MPVDTWLQFNVYFYSLQTIKIKFLIVEFATSWPLLKLLDINKAIVCKNYMCLNVIKQIYSYLKIVMDYIFIKLHTATHLGMLRIRLLRNFWRDSIQTPLCAFCNLIERLRTVPTLRHIIPQTHRREVWPVTTQAKWDHLYIAIVLRVATLQLPHEDTHCWRNSAFRYTVNKLFSNCVNKL